MLFDVIAFGQAYGMVILSFGLGLTIAIILGLLGIGGKNGI